LFSTFISIPITTFFIFRCVCLHFHYLHQFLRFVLGWLNNYPTHQRQHHS
jgi:hypothetical protein